MGFIYTGYVF